MAKVHECGPSGSEHERRALRFLGQELPDDYVVYTNPWIVDRNGRELEVDAVIVGEYALYVVEIKSWPGHIRGNDLDWYVPRAVKSPLKLNRLSAQILKDQLKRRNREAARVWVQGFIFLSDTERVDLDGPGSKDRVYTRSTILGALRNPALVHRLSGRAAAGPSDSLGRDIGELMRGADPRRRSRRRLGEYEVLGVYDRGERFTEYHVHHEIEGRDRVLRVYPHPPQASDEQIEAVRRRVRWETNVFQRLKRHDNILDVESPFQVEEGVALPFEYFEGVSLVSWLDRYSDDLRQRGEDLRSRVDLWRRILDAVRYAHSEGVVHRLLRPEVIRLEDTADEPDLRLAGFELAKRLDSDDTVTWTTIGDDRLTFAAPEVVNAFSDADPASDQFSLGALLGLLVTGRPLFTSTLELMRGKSAATRLAAFYKRAPRALEDAVARMLERRGADRFANLDEAEDAVVRALPRRDAPADARPDPDDLPPGTRVGTDYEIRGKLGQGGLAVVYAAHHLATDEPRALKVARSNDAAEEALRREHDALKRLDHDAVVRAGDLSHMLEERLTLPLELVDGTSLRDWLGKNRDADLATRRRLAEDLLAALEHLEQQGVTHNDLKPDNLLVSHDLAVSHSALKVIDFSLGRIDDDDERYDALAVGGTARYRDVNSDVWNHATDRWAAALCLFELFVGRHAFDGRVPEPGQTPRLDDGEVDPPALAGVLLRTLDPDPAARYASARALRDALVEALGTRTAEPGGPSVDAVDATAELHRLPLSNRALNQLRRAGVGTAGELVALSDGQVHALHAVGVKTAEEILRLRDELRERGVESVPGKAVTPDPALVPELADDPEPLDVLDLTEGLAEALRRAGFTTVGRLAGARRHELLDAPGVGPASVRRLLAALAKRHRAATELPAVEILDDVWAHAAAHLDDNARELVDALVGLTADEPWTLDDLAAERQVDADKLRRRYGKALEALDTRVLDEPADLLDQLLDAAGGLLPLADAAERLELRWLGESVRGAGILRLVAEIDGRFHLLRVDHARIALARPNITPETLRDFVDAALDLAESDPLVAADTSADRLRRILPDYAGNPLALAVQLLAPTVHQAADGELFSTRILQPEQQLRIVLRRERLPLVLGELRRHFRETFGGVFEAPSEGALPGFLEALDCELKDGVIDRRTPRSVLPDAETLPIVPLRGIPPIVPLRGIPARTVERSAVDEARALLTAAAKSRGFRLVVAPPERHREIGRSVAEALDGKWISFEDKWFERHEPELRKMARAERYAAQRGRLTRSADDLFDDLVTDEGGRGRVLVLGDTGILGVLGALDNVRRLYDETLSGEFGFWVLVIPGHIKERQPFFNDTGNPVFHLSGIVLEVEEPLRSRGWQDRKSATDRHLDGLW